MTSTTGSTTNEKKQSSPGNRSGRLRSDSSSIHSSNTKKTSASQSTTKRKHTNNSQKTALISVKKSTSPKKTTTARQKSSQNSIAENSPQSPPLIKRRQRLPNSASPPGEKLDKVKDEEQNTRKKVSSPSSSTRSRSSRSSLFKSPRRTPSTNSSSTKSLTPSRKEAKKQLTDQLKKNQSSKTTKSSKSLKQKKSSRSSTVSEKENIQNDTDGLEGYLWEDIPSLKDDEPAIKVEGNQQKDIKKHINDQLNKTQSPQSTRQTSPSSIKLEKKDTAGLEGYLWEDNPTPKGDKPAIEVQDTQHKNQHKDIKKQITDQLELESGFESGLESELNPKPKDIKKQITDQLNKNQSPKSTKQPSPSSIVSEKQNVQKNLLDHDNVRAGNMSKEENEEDTDFYTPDHNLHLDLENCAWEQLYHQLKELSTKSSQILREISVTSKDDATVLHTACWKAPAGLTLIMIKLLPKRGKKAKSIYLRQDKDGNTPIHLLCANLMPFFDDNSSKPILDVSVLDSLIAVAPEALEIQNKEGDTPLHLFVTSVAASASTFSSCPPSSELIDTTLNALTKIIVNLSGKDSVVTKDQTGATPFHSAIACPSDEFILSKLLEYYPAVCKIGDLNGMIPLHYVAAFLNTPASVVKKMIEIYQFGICHKTNDGDTPLHILVRNSADDVIFDELNDKIGRKKLLNRNAIQLLEMLMGNTQLSSIEHGKNLNQEYDPFFITNKECLTPIHCCALFNASVQVTQLLMGHPSAQRAVLTTNSFGATPLHLAAAQPNVCVDITLAIGTSESALAQDSHKRTPLHVAAQNTNTSTELIECIVDMNQKACETVDDGGNLPLHLALQSGAKEHIVAALVKAHPLSVEHQNKHLDTPLHDAATHNASAEMVKFLLDKYQKAISTPNQVGNLPLHCATLSQAPPDVTELLLEAYPESASLQNKKGDCPLHYLVGNKSVSIAILRLYIDAAESSLNILNKRGQKPIDKAKESGAPSEVVELLRYMMEE